MNNRGSCFKIIIEKEDTANNKTISKEDISTYLNNNISGIKFYAFIEHNCDNKRPHYHLVLKTYNDYSQNSILNDIVKSLLCNKYAVSVMVSRDIVHDIRYLTHKDDYTKYQYTDDQVSTSNLFDYQDIVYKQINPYDIDFESLYNICKECNCNKISIYSAVGLKNAKNYSFLIDDICRHIKKATLDKLNEQMFKTLEKEVKND